MVYIVGDKVKIKEDANQFGTEILGLGLIGIVTSVTRSGAHVSVTFDLTTRQYKIIERAWGEGTNSTSPGFAYKNQYQRCWFFRALDLIRLKKDLTPEEQAIADELKAKLNRSPVEDYILSGLE